MGPAFIHAIVPWRCPVRGAHILAWHLHSTMPRDGSYGSFCCCRHDFVVVETIDFYADEDAELPPPMTQRDVILLNKAGLEDEDAAPEEDTEAGKDGKV